MRRQIATVAMCALISACMPEANLNSVAGMLPFGDGIPSEGRFIDSIALPPPAAPEPEAAERLRRRVEMSSMGIAPLADLTAYAQSVLDGIIAAGPSPATTANVHLIANQGPGALAVPSGDIYLHHAVFEYAANEDQLAFLLAHEYSHVLLQHSPESVLATLRPYLVTAADFAVSNASDDDTTRRSLQFYGSDLLARDVLVPIWDRKLERQADHLGIDLMARAGYNPAEAVRLLYVLKQYEDRFEALYVVERNRLEESIAQSYESNKQDGLIGMALAKLGEGFTDLQTQLGQRHDDAGERMAALYAYTEREYAQALARPLTYEQFGARVARNATALDHYRSAFLIGRTLSDESAKIDLAALEGQARRAVSGRTGDDPYTRHAFSELRAYEKRYGLALENLKLTASQDGFLPLRMEMNRWTWLSALGQRDQALARMQAVGEHYEWPIEVYGLVIPALRSRGNEERATALQLACTARYPQSRDRCA